MVSDLKLLITARFTAIHINVLFEEHLLYLTLCRGENFRKEFANLGEVRSLIPETVRIMALTATAMKSS